MGMDLTAFEAAMKDYYTDDRLQNLVNKERPLTAILLGNEKFYGRKLPIPIKYGNPQSRSAGFSQAQSRAASVASSIEAFDLTRVSDHQVVHIDNETLEASENDSGAWLEARKSEIDGMLDNMADALESGLFRGGYGSIGTVGSSTGSTVTLASLSDAANFWKGQEIVFSESEASHVLRDSGDSLIVAGVNRRTGVVTFTAAVSGITGLANGDHLFIKGDRQNSATPARLRPAGFAAWCPATAPSSGENFFGVDRSIDSLLYGQYYNGASDAIEDALIEGAGRVAEYGYKLDHYFVSFAQYSKLTKNIQDAKRYVEVKVGEVGFETFVIQGPKGPIKVVPAQFCQRNIAWGIQREHCKLYSLKKKIRINDTDGNMVLRRSDADGIEVRGVSRLNFGCRAPASMIQVALQTV